MFEHSASPPDLCRFGRLFHSRGQATEQLLSPICDCVRGTTHM